MENKNEIKNVMNVENINDTEEKQSSKTVSILTLGCKVNQYETEAMIELFLKANYEIVDSEEFADIYVINTCTVTNLSDKKSRQFIRKSKNKNSEAVIAVVGCYSQVSPEQIENIEDVDVILGTDNRNRIVEICENFMNNKERVNLVNDIMKVREFEELKIDDVEGKTRAFIKVQDGCNQYCSYCIIPYARGSIRSRKVESILEEVKRLVSAGFKEVVLTGIHIASYGKDLGDIRLIDLLEEIHYVEGLERIRLGSLEPTLITDDFMRRLSSLKKVCNHFHLSLQSGSDTVLKRMNRKYTTNEYKRNVELIRSYMSDVAFTTDIIVGFPEETDEEFEETLEFVREIGFSKVHVFKYSPREGTPAAKLKQLDGNIKQERSKRLIELSDKLSKEFNESFIGSKLDVLFEEESKLEENYIEGYTTNYIRVLAKGDDSLEGEIKSVEINSTYKDSLVGKIMI